MKNSNNELASLIEESLLIIQQYKSDDPEFWDDIYNQVILIKDKKVGAESMINFGPSLSYYYDSADQKIAMMPLYKFYYNVKLKANSG